MATRARVRVGSSRGGGGRGDVPQTYEGTYSTYGATRGDSVGQPVSPYAYSAAQKQKAYNRAKVMETVKDEEV